MTESGQACDDAACYQVGKSVHTFFSSVRGGGVERRVAKRADDDKGVQERKEVGAKRTKKKRKGKGHGVLDDKQEQGRTGATHQQPKPQGSNMVKKANKDPNPSRTTSVYSLEALRVAPRQMGSGGKTCNTPLRRTTMTTSRRALKRIRT